MRSILLLGCALAAPLFSITAASGQQLAHLWAFDEPIGFSNTFSDSSGNGHTGIGAGDIVPGRFGNAVFLLPSSDPLTGGIGDGVDWVDPTPAGTALPVGANDSWTVNLWTKFAVDGAPGPVEYLGGFGIDDGETDDNAGTSRSIISFHGGSPSSFHFWGASVDLNSGIDLQGDDQWHMYSVTYDNASTDMHMYVDGIRVASTDFGGTTPFANAPAEAHVGNPSNWSDNLQGTIDEFAIFTGALDPGQIGGLYLSNDFTQAQELQPIAEIDRETGEVTIRNGTAAAIDNLVGYRIASNAGALDADGWDTITGRLDNGGGIDAGPWATDAVTDFLLSEADQGAPAGSLAMDAEISLGSVWRASPVEDLTVELLIDEGGSVVASGLIVDYVGNGGASYARSDLNADGVIDVQDWARFSANGFANLSGLSPVEAYSHGDLDGDGDNDRQDFRVFKADYIAANGAAAFAALTAQVPEPSTALLLTAFVGMLVAGTGRRA